MRSDHEQWLLRAWWCALSCHLYQREINLPQRMLSGRKSSRGRSVTCEAAPAACQTTASWCSRAAIATGGPSSRSTAVCSPAQPARPPMLPPHHYTSIGQRGLTKKLRNRAWLLARWIRSCSTSWLNRAIMWVPGIASVSDGMMIRVLSNEDSDDMLA